MSPDSSGIVGTPVFDVGAPRDEAFAAEAAFSLNTADVPRELSLPAISELDNPLLDFAEFLSRRYAVEMDAAIAILLTALAGTVGPARLIVNPLGGCLPGSLNVLVFGEGDPPGLDAMRRATAGLLEVAQLHGDSHRVKGQQGLRRERIHIERCAEELRTKLRNAEADEAALRLDPWALPKFRTKERVQLDADAEAARVRLLYLEIEERPWLMSDGLGPNEIRELSTRSFDRSLLNYSPSGHAWRSLLNWKASVQSEMLHVLSAGWRGDPVVMAGETVYGIVISNLWRIDSNSDFGRIASVRKNPLWDTFLFADIRDTETDIDSTLLEVSAEDAWWDLRVQKLFELRPFKEPFHHKLTAEAREIFLRFYNDHRRQILSLPQDLQRFATRRPEQALKMALLLHLASDTPDADVIEPDVMQAGVDLATRIGHKGLRSAATLFATPPVVIEVEVERMVAKLRIHGPQRKRDLFRRYNSQDYSRLEPLLMKAIEAKVIKSDGEFFASAN